MANPIRMPPITSVQKSRNVYAHEKSTADLLAMPSRVTKRISPTASLNIDSPEIIVFNFEGIFDFFRMAPTAMGSVGEITAPNTKQ